jgi:predicted tellurium resistance membrane protein TerC
MFSSLSTISDANKKFHHWIQSLWFAPNKVKKYARKDDKLIGIYLPYWTYDSDTESTYSGARGDTYYVNQRVTYVQNGRQISRGYQSIVQIIFLDVLFSVNNFIVLSAIVTSLML